MSNRDLVRQAFAPVNPERNIDVNHRGEYRIERGESRFREIGKLLVTVVMLAVLAIGMIVGIRKYGVHQMNDAVPPHTADAGENGENVPGGADTSGVENALGGAETAGGENVTDEEIVTLIWNVPDFDLDLIDRENLINGKLEEDGYNFRLHFEVVNESEEDIATDPNQRIVNAKADIATIGVGEFQDPQLRDLMEEMDSMGETDYYLPTSPIVGMRNYDLLEKGYFVCLDEYLVGTYFYEMVPEQWWERGKVNGKIYTIPNRVYKPKDLDMLPTWRATSGILSVSGHPELAYRMLELIYTEPAYGNLLVYGCEYPGHCPVTDEEELWRYQYLIGLINEPCTSAYRNYTHIGEPRMTLIDSHLEIDGEQCLIYALEYSHKVTCTKCGWTEYENQLMECTVQHSRCKSRSVEH